MNLFAKIINRNYSGRLAGGRIFRGNNYLPTLDGWRAVAILMVLFGHASVQLGLSQFKEVGLLGVQIFFGLSGFLITSLLLREECKSGSISITSFYWRRVFRIFPAAGVFLGVVGILSLLGYFNVSPARWFGALFFMANYIKAPSSWYVGHFWSLAVEEHFYLIWPATMLLFKGNRKRLAITLFGAFAVALWRAIDFKYHLTWAKSESAWFWGRTDINADAILFGVIAALARARLNLLVSRAFVTPLAIAIFALTVVLQGHLNWKIGVALLTVRVAVVPVMILSTLNRSESMFGQFLELKPLRALGLISYSLYLWQQLFLTWEPQYAVQRLPLNILAAFSCAILSYWLIETPMLKIGSRLRMRRNDGSVEASATA